MVVASPFLSCRGYDSGRVSLAGDVRRRTRAILRKGLRAPLDARGKSRFTTGSKRGSVRSSMCGTCAHSQTLVTHSSLHTHTLDETQTGLHSQISRREDSHRTYEKTLPVGRQTVSYIRKCGDVTQTKTQRRRHMIPSISSRVPPKSSHSRPPSTVREMFHFNFTVLLLDSPHNCSFRLVYALQSTD